VSTVAAVIADKAVVEKSYAGFKIDLEGVLPNDNLEQQIKPASDPRRQQLSRPNQRKESPTRLYPGLESLRANSV
jgi:hypothetical protein